MKKPLKDSFIIGFALFSMFFGAGNVIFPPYLGLESGPHWLLGFISYYIADIGLALLAMFAILRQGSPEKVTSRIGKVPSVLLMCAIVLCIGPMLAIPRTAATTFETSVTPLVSGASPWRTSGTGGFRGSGERDGKKRRGFVEKRGLTAPEGSAMIQTS